MSFPKENVTKDVTENRIEFILKMIQEIDRVNVSELAKELKVSRRTILRDIDKLKEQKKVGFKGPSRSGRWVVFDGTR